MVKSVANNLLSWNPGIHLSCPCLGLINLDFSLILSLSFNDTFPIISCFYSVDLKCSILKSVLLKVLHTMAHIENKICSFIF